MDEKGADCTVDGTLPVEALAKVENSKYTFLMRKEDVRGARARRYRNNTNSRSVDHFVPRGYAYLLVGVYLVLRRSYELRYAR